MARPQATAHLPAVGTTVVSIESELLGHFAQLNADDATFLVVYSMQNYSVSKHRCSMEGA